jgi:hypothetical protein
MSRNEPTPLPDHPAENDKTYQQAITEDAAIDSAANEARKMAHIIAGYHQGLVESGVPEGQAVVMGQEFRTLMLTKLARNLGFA